MTSTSRSKLLVGSALLLALIAAGWYIQSKSAPSPQGASAGAGPSTAAPEPPTDAGFDPATDIEPSAVEQGVERGTLESPTAITRIPGANPDRVLGQGTQVVDREGLPIADAWVSWSARDGMELGRALERDHGAILARGIHARTDSEGKFQLNVPDLEVESGGVVWVSHVAHRPAWFVIDHPTDIPTSIALAGAGPLRVIVVDADGRPVPGAGVITFLTDQPTSVEGAGLAPAVHAAFVRSATTDDEGRAVLPPALAEQHALAFAGGLRSAPFYGRAPGEIRLQVGEWSWVQGTVRAMGDVDLGAGLSVTTAAWAPAAWKTLGRVSVREDGTFGPTAVAHDPELHLMLRLEGPGVLPFERTLFFPPAGSTNEVTLEAHPALSLPVQVVDEVGAPLQLADLRAWWQKDGAWIHAHARTDAEGSATLAIRPGEIHLQCQRRGFADQALPGRLIDRALEEPIRIQLERAGVITGRVQREGEPVRTFLVEYWIPGGSNSGSHHEQDQVDGAFRIEGAPLGEVVVHVVVPGWPPSPFHRVLVEPGIESEVLVEMPPRLVGRGQVVDAATGDPLPGGTVGTWILENSRLSRPTGIQAMVEAQGNFEILGLAPGSNFLVIDAPGYAQLHRPVQAQGAGPVDLGRFALVREADLTVRLVGPEHLDPTACHVRITGAPADQARPFGVDSTVVFPGYAAGRVSVTVTLPDGTRLREAKSFRGGVPGTLEVVVDDWGTDALAVEVEGLEAVDGSPFLFSSTEISEDSNRDRIVDLVAGRALIPGPFGDVVWINLWDGRGSILLSRLITRAERASGHVKLRFQDERVTLRLIDRRRDPIAAAAVFVGSIPSSGWYAEGRTDSGGRVRLALPPRGRLLLHARFAAGGGMADVELQAVPRDGRELELVLDPDAELQVRFHDGDVPLHGVRAFLFGTGGTRSLALSGSDASGLASSGPIGAGKYHLEAKEHDLWPIFEPLELRPGPNERSVEIRRLGGLKLEARWPGGVALEGARASLRSVEFGRDVADWIAAGKLPAPAGGLVTDERGELRIGGLPNGAYRYTLVAPDGRVASGEVDVPPHAEGRAVVTFAPQ